MPVVHIEENIQQLMIKMQGMREEILRLEGVLRTFEGFKQAGLVRIDLPNQEEELESIQEKPE
jgi:DNA-binding protein YbaB